MANSRASGHEAASPGYRTGHNEVVSIASVLSLRVTFGAGQVPPWVPSLTALLAPNYGSARDCASTGRYRGRMPPGAKRYARNNTSTSAPPISSTLFLSIASSPFLAAFLHNLMSRAHFASAPASRTLVLGCSNIASIND